MFYNAEASYLAELGDFAGAIAVLDKAEQVGATDEFSTKIRARVLSKME